MKTTRNSLLAAVLLPLLGGTASAFPIPDDVFQVADLEGAKEAATEDEVGITYIYTNTALKPT